ncbi:Protein METHYLENE BLUE SENSITIVITY 1, partial [Frankliniella fusca]
RRRGRREVGGHGEHRVGAHAEQCGSLLGGAHVLEQQAWVGVVRLAGRDARAQPRAALLVGGGRAGRGDRGRGGGGGGDGKWRVPHQHLLLADEVANAAAERLAVLLDHDGRHPPLPLQRALLIAVARAHAPAALPVQRRRLRGGRRRHPQPRGQLGEHVPQRHAGEGQGGSRSCRLARLAFGVADGVADGVAVYSVTLSSSVESPRCARSMLKRRSMSSMLRPPPPCDGLSDAMVNGRPGHERPLRSMRARSVSLLRPGSASPSGPTYKQEVNVNPGTRYTTTLTSIYYTERKERKGERVKTLASGLPQPGPV